MTKIAFLDRDGTIVEEPADEQVDQLNKIKFYKGIVPALLALQDLGYDLVMVTNQDGLGTESFPEEHYLECQNFIMDTLSSQGIHFRAVEVCPHRHEDNCFCRKPNLGLVNKYFPELNYKESFVVGDRASDMELAERIGIRGFLLGDDCDWKSIVDTLQNRVRMGQCQRETKETRISVEVRLDEKGNSEIDTGLKFFDHMLEQISKHSGLSLNLKSVGDIEVDDHHSIEDVGLCFGQALSDALGDRRGIERYGFALPMDEARAEVLIDLGGRPHFEFQGQFDREQVGDLATEMVPHFFKSVSDTLRANIHMKVDGENTHHKVESLFKGFARTLKQATEKTSDRLPSSKGVLV